MKKVKVTSFKVKINSITQSEIGFELYSGNNVDDLHSNVLKIGNFEAKNDIKMPVKHFVDFVVRLVAHVFIEKSDLTDDELKTLWDLKIMIFDKENVEGATSIFHKEIERLNKLNLLKEQEK